MKNLAFIGMMGTGKTVTAAALGDKLQMRVADIDNMIVARVGMPISQAFITFSERTFRDFEYNMIAEVIWQDSLIVSCGGGVPLRERNMELLVDCVKIQLTCAPEEIYLRTKDDFSRPLLKDNSPARIAAIMAERRPVYDRYADFTVDTTAKPLAQVVEEVLACLRARGETF